ncbi:carbonic anhydrase [Streptomyces swartbergensis]|uniref:carbonic anhydrase n=1 Tax=Streptomyces swartbergensis TaxID=487165 RepID=UPI0038113788
MAASSSPRRTPAWARTVRVSGIEYAVQVGVKHVVVCGHSHCGPGGAVVRRSNLAAVPAVRDWLGHGADEPKCCTSDPTAADAVQNHVLTRLERLHAYPSTEAWLRPPQRTRRPGAPGPLASATGGGTALRDGPRAGERCPTPRSVAV